MLKKTITILLILTLLLSGTTYADKGYDLTIRYVAGADAKVVVSGVVGETEGIPVTVFIDRYSPLFDGFSNEMVPMFAKFFTTGTGGTLSCEFPLPEELEYGKYMIYFSANSVGKFQTDFMVYDENSDEFKLALKAVNEATGTSKLSEILLTSGFVLGVDAAYLNDDDREDAAKLLYKWRQIGGEYNENTFSGAYRATQAISLLKSGEELQNVLSKYASDFGTTIEEYEALSDGQKLCLEKLLEKADFTTKLPMSIYDEALLVASISGASSWSKSKELTLYYNDRISLDLGKYNKLSDVKKDKVFMEFYKNITDCTSISDIRSEFADAVASISEKTSNSGGSNGGSGNSGGGGSFGGNTVISGDIGMLNPPVGAFPDIKEAIFNDIEGHFSRESIEVLYEKGIVSGYPTGLFKPDAYVTRAEFAKMLVSALKLSGEIENNFSDVSDDDWFCEYVCVLASKDILRGYNGMVMPNANLTREDAAVMVCRLLGLKAQNEPEYADANDISEYAIESVAALSEKKLLLGDGVNFNPDRNMTRGEVAVFLLRVMSETEEIEND